MSGNQIQYEELAQEALRGVIRTIMTDIEKTGELPGEHHFFIAFDTNAEDVVMSSRLKEQYHEEMTIVLQHQFWDLKATQDYFEVKLSFNNVMERLVIPYKAIKVFFDPSVPYGLQFGSHDMESSHGQSENDITDILDDKKEAGPVMSEVSLENKQAKEAPADAEGKSEAGSEEMDYEDDRKTADIVSLDTFRKK